MTFVKICGLREAEHVRAATEADALGFVVESPRSARNLSLDQAVELAAAARSGQLAVAVTAARDAATLQRIARVGLPALQAPADADLAKLRAAVPNLRIFAALRPGERAPAVADMLVLDAADDAGYGGTAQRLDAALARRAVADASRPTLLAGGLTPANVAAAIASVQPHGVDVSSGVERAGRKDPELIRAFIHQARSPPT